MKRILLMAIAVLSMSVASVQASAAGDKKKEDKKSQRLEQFAEKRTERMKEQLGLSKKQTKKVLKLNQEYAKCLSSMPGRPQAPRAQKANRRPAVCPMAKCPNDSICPKAAQGKSLQNMRAGKPRHHSQAAHRKYSQKAAKQHARRMQQMKQYDESLKDILDQKQYEKYSQLRKEQMQKRTAMRPAPEKKASIQ